MKDDQLFSRRNLEFTLYEVLNLASLSEYEYFEEHNDESFSFILDTATDIADKFVRPSFVGADQHPPELVDGQVKVHQGIHDFFKGFSEAGLIAATFPYELGGIQIPKTLSAAVDFILGCSGNFFIMFTDPSKGVANLLHQFGTEEQKEKFLDKILTGKFLATMALTETEAGSSLSNLTTTAYPQADGTYKIVGQKVFISGGDHQMGENIVHFALARIEGAPEGVRGISLFMVPKYKEDGTSNDVTSIGVYHKMGQKGTPALHLEFGANKNCTGHLLGAPNRGLSQMFIMMDAFRLSVGLSGPAIASAAYYASLKYAKERSQGKRLSPSAAPNPTTIIHHPDVRRMLLAQKVFIEGTLSFLLQCYLYLDLRKVTEDKAEKKRYTDLLNLLTPVAKTYGGEKGIVSVNQGLQVFGGYGYTTDFPLEQLARDVRILPIYEGTTGIHSISLLRRHVIANEGASLKIWEAEVNQTLEESKAIPAIEKYTKQLSSELQQFNQVTQHLMDQATTKNPECFLADATLYMDYFGTLNVAWQWIKQGTTAYNKLAANKLSEEDQVFYLSKIHTMQAFFHYELPKAKGLAERLLDTTVLTVFNEDLEVLI